MTVVNIPILRLVYNRLTFLVPNEDNDARINDFIGEVSFELEPCFKIRFHELDGVKIEDWERVGVEEYYRLDQRSVIADLVAVYVLMMIVAANSQGTPGAEAQPTTTYLKRAKAGSAEVEYGQFSVKDGNMLFLNADSLINTYKASAERRARTLGCIIDVCSDCTAMAETGPLPLMTITDCGCGCGGC